MRKMLVVLLACGMLLSAFGCAPSEQGISSQSGEAQAANTVALPDAPKFDDWDATRAVWENNQVAETTLNGINRFSYETASRILGGENGNATYSPLSLYYALAIAASGADGTTQQELLALLNAADADQLAGECGRLFRLLYTDNEVGRLKLANSLWMDNEVNGAPVTFHEPFTAMAAEDFYAELFTVNFASSEAGKAMGQWIAKNTNNTLAPELSTDPMQLLSIINTIYFKDEWVDRFDKSATAPDTFTREDGSTVTCDFMNMEYGSHGFLQGENYTASSLSLKNQGSMLFILPKDGVPVKDLIATVDDVAALFQQDNNGYGQVTFQIPKFSFDSEFDLPTALKSLGLSDAFDPDKADFSGITDAGAYISSVIQQTHVAIDENGVEASAFTEIAYCGSGMPVDKAELILDRPFLFAITASNGALLFVGMVMDPTAA